jgi:hypothetical protein
MARKLVVLVVAVGLTLGAGLSARAEYEGMEQMDRAYPAGSGGTGPSSAPFQAQGPDSRFEGFETYVLGLANDYWQRAFSDAGFAYSAPYYLFVRPGRSAQSACYDGRAGDPAEYGWGSVSPAFYCSADRAIYLSTGWMYRDVYRRYGDFAVAYVIAHEMGHHAQRQAGTARTGSALELQADCLAGTWSNSQYYAGTLEDGDVQEAVNMAWNSGGLSHGSGEQRARWFWHGYNTGAPARC